MNAFPTILRLSAVACLAVAALHSLLGPEADILLGARIPAAVVADPAFDSQNRFFGASFGLYGVLLWICSSNPARYATILRCLLWTFFVGGLVRIVSVVLRGVPPTPVVVLLLIELIGPLLILGWFARLQRAATSCR